MNNTEAFEFLLSWKDDVLMNCLSGRRDKAFDPQAMQKVRAACAVLAEDGTYPFDLSVTVPGSPTCCASPEPFRHERCIYFPQMLDILCNLHYHKAIKCLFREASRTNKREPVPFCLLCSFLFPLRKRACCDRQKIRRFLCWM